MGKHWQCSSRGARPQVLSLWCPFFMISLKLRGSLLNRCPLCSRPVAKFSITISLLSHLQLKPTTMSRDMKLLRIASEILKNMWSTSLLCCFPRLAISPKARAEVGMTYLWIFWQVMTFWLFFICFYQKSYQSYQKLPKKLTTIFSNLNLLKPQHRQSVFKICATT